jgi:YD repeat-containing protein
MVVFVKEIVHVLSLYVVDWDQVDERTEQITIVDADTQAVLDQQQVDSFTSGIYLRWDVRGHIQIQVEWTFGGYNAVVSGLFLDGASGTPAELAHSRTVSYSYDGLQRLVGATEAATAPLTATTTYTYTYDDAGNRTGVWQDGLQTQSASYNDANQVSGWTYDEAGNLLSGGTTAYSYDALSRVLTQGSTTNSYNGDGVLVAQTTGSSTISYTQDLIAPLSQILNDGTSQYVYGNGPERLYGVAGSTRTWYTGDALASLRATLDDNGAVVAAASYDPWGVPETTTIAPFGFTGELQQGSDVYLRARWYQAGNGAFTARDPFDPVPTLTPSHSLECHTLP